ncbi:para-nitrobenzyl esterase-like [Brevipalpus obovatus]|uniref:para-nitrobenzyl esterase-like n=1 Tax=Brevipalpus obovatus TaxID=246614 RepID=UPI003D9E8B4A
MDDLRIDEVTIISECVFPKHPSPQVQIRDGPVRGSITEFREIKVLHFKGIPYAKPPVDKNRFLPPIKPDPWQIPINGSKYGSSCKQPLKWASSNEDCLYINVFVAEKSFYEQKNLSVMFLIHGGWFLFGSGNLAGEMHPDPLVAIHNIVLVSFNYRLGVYGFFHAGGDVATEIRPNLGFRDQIFALQWVQDNIRYFGGDPSEVTIFGYSSGAESIGLHLLASVSRDLFKYAIMESGAPWYGNNKRSEVISSSRDIIGHFGCSGQSDILSCLQKADTDELMMNSTTDALNENPLISVFRPIFGDDLLPLTTSHALRTGTFNMGKNLLVGIEKDDVAFIIKYKSFHWMKNFTYDQAVEGMKIFTRKPGTQFFTEHYLNPHKNGNFGEIERTILNFANDLYFECPTYVFAGLLANQTQGTQPSVYAYWHTQKPKTSTVCGNIPEAGACHTDELPFIFGAPLRQPGLYSKEDVELSGRMMNIWVHFAKTGDVPPQGPVDWPSLGSEQKGNYLMELNSRRIGVLHHEKFDFCITNWRHFHQFHDPDSINEYNHQKR